MLEQLSGHLPIITVVELPKFYHNSDLHNNLKAVRLLTKSVLEHTRLDLLNTDCSFITITSNVNEDYDTFVDNIVTSFNYRLPITYVKNTLKQFSSSKSCITQGIKKSFKAKSKLYNLVIKGKYHMEKYVQYCNNLNTLIKHCKANYYLNVIKIM